MKALLTAIVTWLSVNFGLPAIYQHPQVMLLPKTEIALHRYGATQPIGDSAVLAVYDDRANTIILPKGWTGRTPAELSILVHEMVHHLQNKGGLKYLCPSAREALAYAAQEKWLEQFGSSLEQDFSIDPMTLKVRTGCMIP